MSVAVAVALVSVVMFAAPAAQRKVKTQPGLDSSNYYPFDQINKSNVSQLEMAWFYPYAAPVFSPVYANDMLYGLGRNAGALVALDATTGKELWVHEGLNGITSKGINYWETPDGKDRRLIFAIDSFLQQIDARTGKSILSFGDNGVSDMRVGLLRAEGTSARAMPASPGRIWRNIMIFGGQSGEQIMTPPGDIRAYDVLTGKLLWQFHVIPRPGEFGYDTNPPDGYKYIGGANNWGEMSIDEERGIVYIPTGSATADFYGGDRPGQNLFANCLLALDVKTGKRLWHFQTVHHDLWDLDNVSAPQLVSVRHNGKKVDVVAHAGKTGFLYVFDRVTGQPLWPIEERPVPKSDAPFEQSWPTQPFPTKPAPFVRQSFTEDDVSPHLLTPKEYEALKERVRNAKNGKGPHGGLFNPTPVNGDAISMPGNQGGSNWGTAAADPQRGLVFVTGVNQVAILRLNDVKDPAVSSGRGGGGGGRGNQPDPNAVSVGQKAYTQYLCGLPWREPAERHPRRAAARRGHRSHRSGELPRDRVRRAQQHAADPRCVQRRDSGDVRVSADHQPVRRPRWRRWWRARTWRGPEHAAAARTGRRQRRRAEAAAAAPLRRSRSIPASAARPATCRGRRTWKRRSCRPGIRAATTSWPRQPSRRTRRSPPTT